MKRLGASQLPTGAPGTLDGARAPEGFVVGFTEFIPSASSAVWSPAVKGKSQTPVLRTVARFRSRFWLCNRFANLRTSFSLAILQVGDFPTNHTPLRFVQASKTLTGPVQANTGRFCRFGTWLHPFAP